MMYKFVSRLEYLPQSLRNFIGQVSGMLEFYFEQLPRRNSAAYAEACARYFRDMSGAGPFFSGATPAQLEYRKVYNRLKTRKNRGKLDADEWNAAVARALELKDRAERGELDDAELKRLYEQF